MILVDTSVLIDFLNNKSNESVDKFKDILSRNIPYGINVFIYMELLQGTASEKDYNRLKKYLDTQKFYKLRNGKESFAEASKIYFKCRRSGYTISSTIDCLIVQTALENNIALLHNDSDYDRIKKVARNLIIW
jgi:predicted nucleic acid-binding protein